MDEHTITCNTETRINKDEVNNIKPIVPIKTPKGKMTKTTFKEKSMKRWSLVTKEASNKQHQTQGRPNHTHNPPSNFPQHQTHQKGGCTLLFKK